MENLAALALRAVLAMLLAGSVFVQVVMVGVLLANDLDDTELASYQRISILVILVLGIAAAQIVLVCVWRLVAMVSRGTVFSHASFRYVDVVIGAITAAAVLTVVLAVFLSPGEEVPPGFVAIVCGLAVAMLGVALVVLVLRMLLAQAVARDAEARHLQAELDEVV